MKIHPGLKLKAQIEHELGHEVTATAPPHTLTLSQIWWHFEELSAVHLLARVHRYWVEVHAIGTSVAIVLKEKQ